MALPSTQPEAHEALAQLYQLEEREGWRLLSRHLEYSEGFSLVVVLAPDEWGIEYIREQLPTILPQESTWRRVTFDPSAPPEQLAQSLLDIATLPDEVRVLWVDTNPGEVEAIAEREAAWEKALARLNRYRNSLQAQLRCTLVFALPVRWLATFRAAAPDLWSVRSGIFRIEPPGGGDHLRNRLLENEPGLLRSLESALSGDPQETLAAAETLRNKPGRETLLAELLHRAGRQALNQFNWELVRQCYEEAFSLYETFSGDVEAKGKISNDLAFLFMDTAQYERAEHYARLALTRAEQAYGRDHPSVATCLGNLAQLLKATNRLAEAEPLFRCALKIDQEMLGLDHPTVAIRLNNLADLFKSTNRLGEAESLMRQALEIDQNAFSPDHPKIALRLNNLAQLLQAANRPAEAEPFMRHALDIGQNVFGPGHPTFAIYLSNLAQLLRSTDRLAEAEPLMRRVLQTFQVAFGPDHPHVATGLNNLAQLLLATNRPSEAEPLMRRAIEIRQDAFGADHPDVATDLNNLACLLQTINRLAEAEQLSERAVFVLLDFTRSTGYEHPQLSVVLRNYKQLLLDAGADSVAATRRILDLMDECGVVLDIEEAFAGVD